MTTVSLCTLSESTLSSIYESVNTSDQVLETSLILETTKVEPLQTTVQGYSVSTISTIYTTLFTDLTTLVVSITSFFTSTSASRTTLAIITTIPSSLSYTVSSCKRKV